MQNIVYKIVDIVKYHFKKMQNLFSNLDEHKLISFYLKKLFFIKKLFI